MCPSARFSSRNLSLCVGLPPFAVMAQRSTESSDTSSSLHRFIEQMHHQGRLDEVWQTIQASFGSDSDPNNNESAVVSTMTDASKRRRAVAAEDDGGWEEVSEDATLPIPPKAAAKAPPMLHPSAGGRPSSSRTVTSTPGPHSFAGQPQPGLAPGYVGASSVSSSRRSASWHSERGPMGPDQVYIAQGCSSWSNLPRLAMAGLTDRNLYEYLTKQRLLRQGP